MIGSTWKRLYFFISAVLRIVSSVALLVGYIVCRVVIDPDIIWLNMVLFILTWACLATGLFNLVMCGMTATAYKDMMKTQLICFVSTLLTGGIFSTILTGVAVFVPVDPEELKREATYNTKTFKFKDGKFDD